MTWAVHAAAILGLVAAAWLLARIPRELFAQVAGAAPPRRAEAGLAAGLAGAGIAVFEVFPTDSLIGRLLLAVAVMAFVAVVYADLRYLVIPDLYSLVVAAPALAGPLSPGLMEAALGAVACGGLLAVIAWVWKARTKVEGMGLGDVKLAAAIGALIGVQQGLWAITASAAGGAAIGLALQARARDDAAPLLFPYGAPLALAGAALLLWSQW